MDMLSQENKTGLILIIILFCFANCIDQNNKGGNEIFRKSKEIISEVEYNEIYAKMNDSLKSWSLNKLPNMLGESMWGFYLDSLVCFNSSKDKLITSILVPCKNPKCVQDEIKFLYGKKISSLWFFFRGPSISIPREMVKNHDLHDPLSYNQLHEIALKEVYSGYLNEKGEINDSFFSDLNSGAWCTDCKTQQDWDNAYLMWVRRNWEGRDTTKPIMNLP